MLYHEFLNLTHNYSELLTFLCDKKVIRDQVKCPRCNKIIHLNAEQFLLYHCTGKYFKQVRGRKRVRKTCNYKISALTGTWFAQAALDLQKICRLICYFMLLNSPRQLFLEAELSISSHTAVDWINFCREVYYWINFCREVLYIL